jgi:glycosyltransferase involved in cell wall biosynthesis
MINVLAFQPKVANSRTAFEPMSLMYKYLERNHDYDFTIVAASSDTFEDEQLKVVSMPVSRVRGKVWEASRRIDRFPVSLTLPSEINDHFEEADAVLTVDPTSRPAGVIGIKRALATDTPVWFYAGRTTTQQKIENRTQRHSEAVKRVVRDVTGIGVTSPKVFEYFRDIDLFDVGTAEKFTVLGHPTDTSTFVPAESNDEDSEDKTEILTIARLVPEKGLYYILEALDPILRERDGVRFRIVGEGPMEPLLEREIRERGLMESIELTDTVPHSQVPTLFQKADILINHAVDISDWEEFFGAANIEAMACGVPCILSDSGSIPYVTRIEDGVELVRQRDVAAIRKQTRTLIDDPERRTEMGRAARKFVEREYSVQAIGEKFHQMLRRGLH